MIYLDNAATSFPKPKTVLDELERCSRLIGANPGRGQYKMSLEAGRVIFKARRAVARLLGVGNSADIAFTANATEALNLAIKGWVRDGDTVVTTSIEHNSVYRPLEYLARNHGVKVLKCSNFSNGDLDLADLKKLIDKTVRLVVVTHASNVIGNILPIADIAEIAHAQKVPLLVDAAQTIGSVPLSIEEMGIDMLAFTGHKALLGPQGTGGLFMSPEMTITELKQGGTGGASKESQPTTRPDRYESGTPNTWGIGGLGAAAKFLLETKVKNVFREEQRKMETLIAGLNRVPGVRVFGPAAGKPRVSLVSLLIKNVDPRRTAFLLDKHFDIAARAGFLCAPEAHRLLGTYRTGTLRLSPGYFSTDEDIELAIKAVSELAQGS